jgi:serine-type D-Ala-D-Ala carboxypeptidase/endopeptidase (penicillin-binding protein 4)
MTFGLRSRAIARQAMWQRSVQGRVAMGRLLATFAVCFVCVCSMFSASAAQSDASAVPASVQRVISGHGFPASSYALLVQEVGEPAPVLAINSDLALNPASTMKVLTTLAALELLGPTHVWTTDVYALGTIEADTLTGDLLIRGGGDPFLVEEHVRSLLKAVQRRGVKRITGDLLLDVSLFSDEVSQGTSLDNQGNRAYNVLPHALMMNFQAVNFYFYPHANGRDVLVRPDPALPNLHIDNRLRQQAGACTGFQRGVSFSEDLARNTVIFSGRFPSGCSEFSLARTVLDAPQYVYGLFSQLWRELGGEFEGEMKLMDGLAYDSGSITLVTRWSSPPLSDVIKSVNKFSNNMMTRHLLLTLALQQHGPPATVNKGVAAVHNYLGGLGIDHSSLVIDNGSGLSRDARMTANLLGAILQRGYDIPNMPEFMASLPLSGLDGTMRSRLTGEFARGRVHVKTGSLSGVAAIAGYVHAYSGKRFIVVAMVNHPGSDMGTGQELGDALMQWVLGL